MKTNRLKKSSEGRALNILCERNKLIPSPLNAPSAPRPVSEYCLVLSGTVLTYLLFVALVAIAYSGPV